MREPRYRFPDHVRDTTRAMASRMISEEEIADSPEELEAWLAERPETRESLKSGGYGTKFDASDLHPLLMVFVAKQGGGQRDPEPSTTRSRSGWIAAVVAIVVVVVLAVLLVAAAPLPDAPTGIDTAPTIVDQGESRAFW